MNSIELPHDADMENTVLGEAMLKNSARLKIVSELRANDFYVQTNRLIFSAMQDMTMENKGVDLPLLSQELVKRKQLDKVGGIPFLTKLATSQATTAYVDEHINVLKALAARRDALEILDNLQAKVTDLGTDNEQAIAMHQALSSIVGEPVAIKTKHLKSVKDVFFEMLTDLDAQLKDPENKKNGIKTGLLDLDSIIGSLKLGDLYIIGGRPSDGKSTLALTIAINAAKAGKKVLFCGLEMSNIETLKRVMAEQGGIDGTRLFNPARLEPNDWSAMYKAGEDTTKLPIYFDDDTSLSPIGVRQKAMEFKQLMGDTPDLIVVDYLQLMTAGMRKENRVQEISYITRTLKNLAGELQCAILLPSQLNRNSENDNRPPRLADLRESGSIEQDASGVILIQREKLAVIDENGKRRQEDSPAVTLHIAKWRNAQRNVQVQVFFDGAHYLFRNLSKTSTGNQPPKRGDTNDHQIQNGR